MLQIQPTISEIKRPEMFDIKFPNSSDYDHVYFYLFRHLQILNICFKVLEK